MKSRLFTITAMTASLLMGTAMMASAQSNDQMNSSGSNQMDTGGSSGGTMDSGGTMKSGDMQSGTMKSGSMKSGDMKSGNMMSSNSDVPMVGGAPMYPNKTIVQNASQAKNLTTLVTAVKAAGLVDTLSGDGPFTVFAPTNKAFKKLPKGTVQTLVKPENKSKLTKILTYHVVPGDLNNLKKKVKQNGSVNLKTVEGDPITVKMNKHGLVVIDKSGGGADIIGGPVPQANGVVYVIGSVLMP